uniref:Replicase n=1 Tax=Pistacia ribo-like virus TaxID=2794234 RepID=A0A7T0Q734_9VIRU|nr:replicase [Pistacia ribo-like virus]
MDPQTIIDTATTANAVSLGNAVATEYFREKMRGSYIISTALQEHEKRYLQRMVSFPLIFKCITPVTHDHTLVAAIRELCRSIMDKSFDIKSLPVKTLVMGAGHREIKLYNSNDNIHYYIHGGESKDYERIVTKALKDIHKTLKDKIRKLDPKFLGGDSKKNIVKRYRTIQTLYDDWSRVHKLPPNIHTDLVSAQVLIFEDSIYNYRARDLVNVFDTTGAQMAYGYAVLPMEFLFPNMPESMFYKFATYETMLMEKRAIITWKGFTNGYDHNYDAWSTLLKTPVIGHLKDNTELVVEIISRIGPMSVFKIFRAKAREMVPRTITLTDTESYVRILDIYNMYDRKYEGLKDIIYISVREDEFWDTFNYLASLDDKALTLPNVINFVRRRMSGISLVNKELVAPWDLPKTQLFSFCVGVLVYVKHQRETVGNIAEAGDVKLGNAKGVVRNLIDNMKYKLMDCIYHHSPILWQWLGEKNLNDKIVIFPINEITQLRKTAVAKINGNRKNIDAKLEFDMPDGSGKDEDVIECPLCLLLGKELGDQIIKCEHKEDSYHTFQLSIGEIDTIKAELMNNDQDPPGLREVKDLAKKCFPRNSINRTVKVNYIRAGPGCGKSYLIRKLADEGDLILAPFSKLAADYKRLTKENGDVYDLPFKTIHRAVETKAYKRIFLDEFTAFPYEYLCAVVENNACEEVYLVGDHKQTRIKEPEEGKCILNHIDLTKLSTHELLVNFRNPPDTVALLNKLFGYNMISYKPPVAEPSIKFLDLTDRPHDLTSTTITFTTKNSHTYTGSEKHTVRCHQGSTYDDTNLVVTAIDKELIHIESLLIVAFSRHKNNITIYKDDSTVGDTIKQLMEDIEILKDRNYAHYISKENNYKPPKKKEIKPTDPETLDIITHTDAHTDIKYAHNTIIDIDVTFTPQTISTENEDTSFLTDIDTETDGGLERRKSDQGTLKLKLRELELHKEKVEESTDAEASEIYRTRYQYKSGSHFKLDYNNLKKNTIKTPGNTENKITQVISFLDNHFKIGTKKLVILGAASHKGATNSPMVCDATSRFNTIHLIDPHFEDKLPQTDTISYYNVAFQKYNKVGDEDLIFSDMYMTNESSINNGLRAVINHFKNTFKKNTDTIYVHKLTWSTTDISDLAIAIRMFSYHTFLRINASGTSSEYYLILRGLNRTEVLTEIIADRVNFMWSHADTCESCRANICNDNEFLNIYSSVYVNCAPVEGIYEKDFYDGGFIEPVGEFSYDVIENFETKNCFFYAVQGHLTEEEIIEQKRELLSALPLLKTDTREVERLKKLIKKGEINDKLILLYCYIYKIHIKLINKDEIFNFGKEEYRKVYIFYKNNHFCRVKPIFKGSGYKLTQELILPPNKIHVKEIINDEGVMEGYDYLKRVPKFFDFLETFMPSLGNRVREVNEPTYVPKLVDKAIHPGRDAYLNVPELLGPLVQETDITALNLLRSQIVKGTFASGKTRIDDLIAPRNARGNIGKVKESFYSYGPGYGLHYTLRKPMQTLAVMESRYLGRTLKFPFGYAEDMLAQTMVKYWFVGNMKKNHEICMPVFDELKIDTILNEYFSDVRRKSYDKRFMGLDGDDDPTARLVRFTLKNIFKPKFDPKLDKVGQGISAWSPQTLALFCGAFRVITDQIIFGERENVITDNKMSETDFIRKVSYELNNVPTTAKFGITDGEEFDANQNLFTQAIEKHLLRKIGISEVFIDLYYSFRIGYTIRSNYGSGTAGTQKTSGEPGTLLNNGNVAKVVSNWVMTGDGPYVLIYKGDDYCRKQCNLEIRYERLDMLYKCCPLKLRVYITDQAEFCGLVVCDGFIFPSLPRKLNKIAAHRFRDYQHFCEYQTSLRDYVSLVESLGAEQVIACNAQTFGNSFSNMEGIYDSIKSFSHINEKQFNKTFTYREEESYIPTLDKYTNKLVMREL